MNDNIDKIRKHLAGKLCCKHCSWMLDLDPSILWIVQCVARDFKKETGKKLYATSGGRCKACNKRAKARPHSAHVVIRDKKRSKAFDVSALNNFERYIILASLFSIGINRIGVSKRRKFIHFDVGLQRDGYPQKQFWIYQ